MFAAVEVVGRGGRAGVTGWTGAAGWMVVAEVVLVLLDCWIGLSCAIVSGVSMGIHRRLR